MEREDEICTFLDPNNNEYLLRVKDLLRIVKCAEDGLGVIDSNVKKLISLHLAKLTVFLSSK